MDAHNESIWAVSWGGEGDRSTIATGSADPKAPIKLWSFDPEINTPTCKHTVAGHILAVTSLALTPDANSIKLLSISSALVI